MLLTLHRDRKIMNQDALKKSAAEAALKEIPEDAIIGVGTGSTVNHFIDGLAQMRGRIAGAVSSSEASSKRLKALGIEVFDLNNVNDLPVYVDGADEITRHMHMIKGGGGALTREKIVAAVAKRFICIADTSKWVGRLGNFPLPVEVIPMSRSYVARELMKLGGQPALRSGFVTDNGNVILDVHHLDIMNPVELEGIINQIAGVVTCGLFARRAADVLFLADSSGIHRLLAER